MKGAKHHKQDKTSVNENASWVDCVVVNKQVDTPLSPCHTVEGIALPSLPKNLLHV